MPSKKSTKKNNENNEQFPGLAADVRERLAKAGYVNISSSGEIQKWEVGKNVEGRFCGMKEGPQGKLFSIETDPGTVETWGCPKVLQGTLASIALGTMLFIECVGQKPSSKFPQNDMWMFEVHAKNAA